MKLLQQSLYLPLISVYVNLIFVTNIHCGLQPYYIHFPPPIGPVPNGLEHINFPYPPPWHSNNSVLSRNFPRGPIPLLLHTWVKPETSEGVKLQNGTIIYYVSPPWGGIRASSPTSASPHATTTLSNSLSESDDYATGGKEMERLSLFENPNRQSGYPDSVGMKVPNIDITTPPPNRDGGSPWGHGHLGFGWPTATQLYDKLPETTTDPNPTRSQNSTTRAEAQNQTTTLKTTTTEKATTSTTTRSSTTTPDPIAANTNARFPVSDSVRKFRRIVAQIRAITKLELAAPKTSKT